ncbi:N-acetylmuramoyl-L-alanine amidase [Anaerosalibacter massiliensis]|uniref:Peptidoglycan-binding protein n=1 Tax=Anaerosalibacter massiliensis TaxID=1347392 RepID=A0A9X2MKI9_9FIRM|nr:peptidoglycan-binding protein [Anaerosalibacter massiliensis]MCR2045176.1 peptidoglycan-binding protein [Anaerosalibacter massiliensis]
MKKRLISFLLIISILVVFYIPNVDAAPEFNRLLRTGSRGSDVATVQRKLNDLGYNAGKADGIFGNRTYNAVVSFQRANGLSADGIVGKNTINKLYSNPSKPNNPSNPGNSAPITSLLRRGSRGSEVVTLQSRLNELGYNAGKADGIFGGGTYNAVVSFQRANGLSADGIVGKNTVNKLYSNPSKPNKPSNPSNSGNSTPITSLLRRGSRGPEVVTLQNRLNELGYNAGKADGIFGGGTYNAVVKFQRANGLSADGIVGKNTINKLYANQTPAPTPGSDDFIKFRGIPGSLKGKVVILDPGHGGSDSGALSSDKKYKEKDFALDIAKRLERILKEAGAKRVVMTRNSDVYLSLQQRVNIVNKIESEEAKAQSLTRQINETEREIAQINRLAKESEIEENKTAEIETKVNLLNNEINKKAAELITSKEKIQGLNIQIEEMSKANIKEPKEEVEEIKDENVEEVENVEEIVEEVDTGKYESEIEEEELNIQRLTEEIEALNIDKEELEKERQAKSNSILNEAEDKTKLESKLNNLQKELKSVQNTILRNKAVYAEGSNEELDRIMRIAGNNPKDNMVFLTIHCNSTTAEKQTSASGIRVYWSNQTKSNVDTSGRIKFAQKLNEQLNTKNTKNKFDKKAANLYTYHNLYVLKNHNLVGALIEIGFMNNPNDIALMKKQQTREDIAEGMYKGIIEYFK